MIDKKPIQDMPNKAFGDKHFASEFNTVKTFLLKTADAINNYNINITGEASPESSPTPWKPGDKNIFEKWEVKTAGTYTNFKDASLNPIIVTADDLDKNIVQIWVTNGVSKKELTSLPSVDYNSTDLNPTSIDKAETGKTVANFVSEKLEANISSRINAGENSNNPQYFKAAPDEANAFGIRFESNDGPASEYLSFKRVFFSDDDPSGATMFKKEDIFIGLNRPSLISFSYWFKKDEFDSIFTSEFKSYLGYVDYSFNAADIIAGKESIVNNTPDIPEYSSAVGKCKIIAEKEINGVSFIRVRINFENIVWKSTFTGNTIAYFFLFNGSDFFQKQMSVYDFTILTESAQYDTVYNGVNNEFSGSTSLKDLNDRLKAVEGTGLDIRVKRDGDILFVGMPFSNSKEIVSKLNVFRNNLTENRNVNFEGEFLIDKDGGLTSGNLIKDSSDDIAPILVGGSYIGGNHGWALPRKITKTAHGKTYADIGKVATDAAGNEFTIIQITNANSFIICAKNKATDGFTYTFPEPSGTLTFPEGAFSGYTSEHPGNVFPFIKSVKRQVLINGSEELGGGERKCNFVDVIDVHDIYDLTSVVLKVIADRPSGGYTSNLDFTEIGADKLINVSIVYRYIGNTCLINQSFYNYKKMTFEFANGIQMMAFTGGNLYINKSTPLSDGTKTYDFRKGENWTSAPAGPIYLEKTKWENSTNSPDRFIQYDSSKAFAVGFVKSKGFDRTNNANAGWLYTSRKIYPRIADTQTIEAFQNFSFQSYRSYQDRSNYPVGRISKVEWLDNGEYYLMLDWNASIFEKIELPKEVIGKKIEVIEKTPNVSILSEVAISELGINVKVDTANVYGYCVLRIK